MKPPRSLPVLAVSVLVLLLAGCTAGGEGKAPAASEVSTQSGSPRVPLPGQAILVRGSEAVRGIAGFGRNAIPALFGEYAVAGGDGEIRNLTVWFTRETLVMDDAWSALSCPGLPAGFSLAQSSPPGAGPLVVVASAKDYRIVISLPPGFGSPCRFTSALLERFMFFMRNAVREEDISFPAFLQL